ncbi:MAG: hypothetical protein AAF408_11845 [Pseudomonadota bacterium]
MTPEQIEAMFTRDSGDYVFARWQRPIVPVVFGVDDKTLPVVKGAFEAVATLAGHGIAETDPELGVNCMLFFFRDWGELTEVPDLDRLIPDLGPLVDRLIAADAGQYRFFRFEENGAIRAAFVFIRMTPEVSAIPAETLALAQVVQAMVLWSETAFAVQSPLAVSGETTILRPDIADLIRASYDPVMPVSSRDRSHALRLYARMGAPT